MLSVDRIAEKSVGLSCVLASCADGEFISCTQETDGRGARKDV